MDRKPSYIRSALKEPLNLGTLILGAAGTAYASLFGAVDGAVIAAGVIVSEAAYLAIVPASYFYRRLVDRPDRGHARRAGCRGKRAGA